MFRSIATLTLCLATVTAQAALIEYSYTGTVGGLDDGSNIGYIMPASPGDTFTATFVIDSDTADANPSDTYRGAYPGAVKSWSVSIAGQTLTASSDPLASINWWGDGVYIDNDSPIYPETCPPSCDYLGDWFQMSGSDWVPGSDQRYSLLLFFGGYAPYRQFLSSDQLPLSALDPQVISLSFDNLYLTKFDPTTGAYSNIFMNATAVVPVPPAVWLFGSALGLMGVARRKAIA